jgi:hypothetical protein
MRRVCRLRLHKIVGAPPTGSGQPACRSRSGRSSDTAVQSCTPNTCPGRRSCLYLRWGTGCQVSVVAPPEQPEDNGHACQEQRQQERGRAVPRDGRLRRRRLGAPAPAVPLLRLECRSGPCCTKPHRDTVPGLLAQGPLDWAGNLVRVGVGPQGHPDQRARIIGETGLHAVNLIQMRQHGREFITSVIALDSSSFRAMESEDHLAAGARIGRRHCSGPGPRRWARRTVRAKGVHASQAGPGETRRQKQGRQPGSPARGRRNHVPGPLPNQVDAYRCPAHKMVSLSSTVSNFQKKCIHPAPLSAHMEGKSLALGEPSTWPTHN